MNCRLQTYIVRTMHGPTAISGGTGNAFIVPVEVEAISLEDAARERFNILAPREQAGCTALLVEAKLCGAPHLFNVEKITTPSYKIKPA